MTDKDLETTTYTSKKTAINIFKFDEAVDWYYFFVCITLAMNRMTEETGTKMRKMGETITHLNRKLKSNKKKK